MGPVTALQQEIDEKSERLVRLGLKWIVTAPAILFFSRSEAFSVSTPAWIGWLLMWMLKGVWDIAEDVSDDLKRSISVRLICLIGGCSLALVLPSSGGLVLWTVLAVMLVGSIVAGGVDSVQWVLSAVFLSCGLVRGWFALPHVLASDLAALAIGGVLHAVIDGIIDRLEWKSIIGRLKLVPMCATGLLLVFMGGPASRAVFLFALVSPHFLIYDFTKVITATLLLRNLNGSKSVAGPMDSLLRKLFLEHAVSVGAGRAVSTVTDAEIGG